MFYFQKDLMALPYWDGFIFPNAPSPTHWLRFGGIGSTSNNWFNGVSVYRLKFSPAELPRLNTMPVHPLPLLCLRSHWCSSSFFLVLVNKATNCLLSNCPLAQTPLFHCPMISLCCNAPCACWTASTGFHLLYFYQWRSFLDYLTVS